MRDLVPHVVVEDEYDLLRPSDRRDGYQDLAAVRERAVDRVDEVHLDLLARGHYVLLVPVCRLGDERLDSWVVPARRVEELGPSVLVVAGVDDVVHALSDVEVDRGRAEYVPGVVEDELDVGRDVGDRPVLERYRVLDEVPDVLLVVEDPPALHLGDLDEIVLEERHQGKRRLRAVDRAVVAELVERREEPHVVEVAVAQDDGVYLVQVDVRPVKARVGVPAVLRPGGDPSVHQHLALRGLDEPARPPHLLSRAEALYRDMLGRGEPRAEDALAQLPVEPLPLVAPGPHRVIHGLDGRGRDVRGLSHLDLPTRAPHQLAQVVAHVGGEGSLGCWPRS